MSGLGRRRRRAFDIWPGFVDALTSLIMVMIFVLLIFAIGQFVLSDTLAGKNKALDALHAQVAELARTLSLNEEQKRLLDARVAELSVRWVPRRPSVTSWAATSAMRMRRRPT
jgi:chemotaxis protein MotB